MQGVKIDFKGPFVRESIWKPYTCNIYLLYISHILIKHVYYEFPRRKLCYIEVSYSNKDWYCAYCSPFNSLFPIRTFIAHCSLCQLYLGICLFCSTVVLDSASSSPGCWWEWWPTCSWLEEIWRNLFVNPTTLKRSSRQVMESDVILLFFAVKPCKLNHNIWEILSTAILKKEKYRDIINKFIFFALVLIPSGTIISDHLSTKQSNIAFVLEVNIRIISEVYCNNFWKNKDNDPLHNYTVNKDLNS